MMTLLHRWCLVLPFVFCAGCGEEPTSAPETSEQAVYSAATLYQNVSIRMASQDGYAFSPDASKILITSDESGVFNVMRSNSTTVRPRNFRAHWTTPLAPLLTFPRISAYWPHPMPVATSERTCSFEI